jgi:hypothetical protein
MMWQAQAIFRKKSLISRNPPHAYQPHRVEPALHGAEAELPTICSVDDFFLIKLRHRQAGPISIFQ